MKIACIGEAMVELSIANDNDKAQVRFAGDTLNTAIYLKRTLDEIRDTSSNDEVGNESGVESGMAHQVAYITILGTDTFSDQILSTVQSEGIDTQFIVRTRERVPGLYAINTDAQGERSFTYWRNQSAARLLFDESTGPAFKQLEQFDLLYYSAITLAILPVQIKDQFLSFLEYYRQLPGKQVAFDSNYRPALWASIDEAKHYTTRAWQLCDIALPSVDDEMALFNEKSSAATIERLNGYDFAKGALKRGAEGPLDIGRTGNIKPDSKVFVQIDKVVDSTAAGDSFNGGYLASTVSDQSSMEALIAGHRCASRVIQFAGAIVDKTLWNEQ